MTDGNTSVKRLLQQNQTTVLRRVGEVSQAVVAERANLSPSLVSRILSGKDAKEGDDELGGALHRVIADRIETGSYAAAAAITGGAKAWGSGSCPLSKNQSMATASGTIAGKSPRMRSAWYQAVATGGRCAG